MASLLLHHIDTHRDEIAFDLDKVAPSRKAQIAHRHGSNLEFLAGEELGT